MRKKMILGVLMALLLCAGSSFANSTGYDEYPGESVQPNNEHRKLIEALNGNVRLVDARLIGMGKKSGKLLFLEYERDDTTPPSRLICAYSQVKAHKYKLIIPEITLYYGKYRSNSETRYHVRFRDVNNDGEIEIVVFSDEQIDSSNEKVFHLDSMYFYSDTLGMFVVGHPSSRAIPEQDVDLGKSASLFNGSYSYTEGYLNYYVETE